MGNEEEEVERREGGGGGKKGKGVLALLVFNRWTDAVPPLSLCVQFCLFGLLCAVCAQSELVP